jgi:hypothetical protein
VRRTGLCLGVLALLAALGSAGCGPKSDTVAPVRGTVSYRGAPLRTGTIVFTPDSSKGTRGPLAMGEIQPDGSFMLKTGDSSGAVPGWHRVTVVAVQAPQAAPEGHKFPIPPSILPEKYRDPDLCGLSREVKGGQANVIDFNLD